jgi:acyl-CoA thioester hydrolase
MYHKEFEVRDYELDLQGIVNNAVYNNYFEHTRHCYLKSVGLDFAQLHVEGIDAVVVKMETEYKNSLKSGDTFICSLMVEREGRIKIIFHQDIVRKTDQKICAKTRVTVACIKNNRPIEPLQLIEKMKL